VCAGHKHIGDAIAQVGESLGVFCRHHLEDLAGIRPRSVVQRHDLFHENPLAYGSAGLLGDFSDPEAGIAVDHHHDAGVAGCEDGFVAGGIADVTLEQDLIADLHLYILSCIQDQTNSSLSSAVDSQIEYKEQKLLQLVLPTHVLRKWIGSGLSGLHLRP
jgi:hypothetical protein